MTRFFVLLLVLCGALLRAVAAVDADALQQTPSEQLMALADSLYRGGQEQRAMIVYEIVASRYVEGDGVDKARLARDAYSALWEYNYLTLVDTQHSLEILERIEEIDETFHRHNGFTALCRGQVIKNLYDMTGEKELCRTAFKLFRKAFRETMDTHNLWYTDVAFGNLLITAIELPHSDIKAEWREYKRLPKGDFLRNYNGALGEALQAHGDRRLALLEKLIATTPGNECRALYYLVYAKARCLGSRGDYAGAVSELQRFPKLYTDTVDFRDVRMDFYLRLSLYNDSAGRKSEARDWYMRYGLLKDSTLNYQQITALKGQEMGKELRRVSHEVGELRWQSRVRDLVLGFATLLLVAIATAWWLLYRKNRRLNQTIRSLYEKNSAQPMPVRTAKAQPQLLERMAQVRDHHEAVLNSDFSAQQFAELVGESYVRLSQVINDECGCNFAEYIAQRRIAEACRRIDSDAAYRKLTIDAIAASVGIKSRTTFSKYFMKFTGLRPSEYVKQAGLRIKN